MHVGSDSTDKRNMNTEHVRQASVQSNNNDLLILGDRPTSLISFK
jgi:hypothetical protein